MQTNNKSTLLKDLKCLINKLNNLDSLLKKFEDSKSNPFLMDDYWSHKCKESFLNETIFVIKSYLKSRDIDIELIKKIDVHRTFQRNYSIITTDFEEATTRLKINEISKISLLIYFYTNRAIEEELYYPDYVDHCISSIKGELTKLILIVGKMHNLAVQNQTIATQKRKIRSPKVEFKQIVYNELNNIKPHKFFELIKKYKRGNLESNEISSINKIVNNSAIKEITYTSKGSKKNEPLITIKYHDKSKPTISFTKSQYSKINNSR